MRSLSLVLIVSCLIGCQGSSPDLSGRWNMAMGPTNMQIEFGSNGQYTGTMTGMAGVGNVTGSYSVKGNRLEMDPPTVTGPMGATSSPGGGRMKVKMIPQGPNMILLDAGDQKFTLTRMGPPK